MAPKKEYMCVDSVIPTVGKRIAQYTFRDYLLIFKADPDDKCFYIWVSDRLDEEHVKDFVAFWGSRWIVYRVPEKEIKKYQLKKV